MDIISYSGLHARLKRRRGKASDQQCSCGKQAREWAYDGTDPNELVGVAHGTVARYSLDLDRYASLCWSCHRRRDDSLHRGQTHCKNGHEFTEGNTYFSPGRRSCRACNRRSVAAYQARRRATVLA